MSKEQWIEEVYELLCKSQGAPESEIQKHNLRGWAEACANCDGNYFEEGMTPKEAHDEEISCA